MSQAHRDVLDFLVAKVTAAGFKVSFCGGDPDYLSDKNFEEMTDSELFSVMVETGLSNTPRCNAADRFYVQRRRGREKNYRQGVYAD
jgi:hypothetical protein